MGLGDVRNVDPVGAEVNMDTFLFEMKNKFFAKSNN